MELEDWKIGRFNKYNLSKRLIINEIQHYNKQGTPDA